MLGKFYRFLKCENYNFSLRHGELALGVCLYRQKILKQYQLKYFKLFMTFKYIYGRYRKHHGRLGIKKLLEPIWVTCIIYAWYK